MRKLKAHQKHGCDFCREAGVKTPAVWADRGNRSCTEHKEALALRSRDDDRLTEADYQTWLRL